ncbi:MAG: hypothetical protein ACYTG7_07180 [Planctomycetota bacterium]|jgi:hypothetical protein
MGNSKVVTLILPCIFLLLLPVHSASAQWEQAVLEPLIEGPENDYLGKHAVEVDYLGNLHLVYSRVLSPIHHAAFYMTKPHGGEWTAPAPIGDPEADIVSPFMSAHKISGQAYVVFMEDGLMKLGIAADSTWTYHDLPASEMDQLFLPALAVDDEGRAHVAVIGYAGGIFKMCYGLWDGSLFSFDVLEDSYLGDYGSGAAPDLCIKSDGSVAISYRGGNYDFYRIDVAENDSLGGSDWEIQSLVMPGYNSYSSSLEVNGDDDLFLAFDGRMTFSGPSSVFFTYKESDEIFWNPAVEVNGDLSGGDVDLAVEADGTAHIVFQETAGNFYTGNICFASNQGGAWHSGWLQEGSKIYPSFVIDHAGNGNMVFQQYASSQNWDIHYFGYVETPYLSCDLYTIDALSGGTVNLALDAGSDNADRNYIVLGSITGTKPGTLLPGGMAWLPVEWDFFTDLVFGMLNGPVFSSFLGSLDADGVAKAQLNAPPVPGFSGTMMYYAYALNNPFDFASTPIRIEIVP